MKGKWKARAMAAVMAFCMGISSAASYVAYAAEDDAGTGIIVETPGETVENEGTPERKQLATAEDLIKDVSDTIFDAETSLEGITYDPEQESVILSSLEDEDGNSYQKGQDGVFYAQYLVTPKDGSECYTISRIITLTDTEGEAHVQDNGGEKQKEDTQSEDDSEDPVPVEVESSEADVTEEELDTLEQEIETGKVLMLSAADGLSARRRESVHLVQGERIWYPSHWGRYSTCWFTVNGKIAYCLESQKNSPSTGDYVADVLDSNANLQKVLYYGYGGAGDITGSYLSGKSTNEKYVYTHIAASYAYAGDAAFTGCDYCALVADGVINYINYLLGLENPPKGELSLSKTNVTAVRDGDVQKTPEITLNGDHRNSVTISVPAGVTGYNKTQGTNVTKGDLKVYGGDTFYLQAPLTVTGNWNSGALYGTVRESWKTLVLSATGDGNQAIGAFISESAGPVSFGVKWLNLARVQITKADAETGNPLDGAVYGVYRNSACTDLVTEITATGENGISYSDYFDAGLETVYVKEITAPEGYLLDETEYDVNLSYEGQEVEVVSAMETVMEQVMKQAFQIIKISEDGEQTETDLVAGAEFTVYLISDLSQVKDGTLKPANGSTFTAEDFTAYDFSGEDPAVTYENGKAVEVPVLVTDKSGYAKSVELPYGQYVVVETKTPENLKQVNPFIVTVDKDSREPQQWRVFDDRPFEFLLKIIKMDTQTNQNVLKKNCGK